MRSLGLALALALAVLVHGVAAAAEPTPGATAAQARPNVVLISLDTTRADALSCYGVPPGPYRVETQTTPVLDALAAEGARFTRFFAHAPSTLSSHTSMLTGLDPHAHAVPRNGFPVAAGLPRLPQRLADAGWDTIAVVGSAALSREMGLDLGFRVYDDDVSDKQGLMVQAPADSVVRRALAAVDGRDAGDAPLFLFAHFYDPHTPYTPPEAFAQRFTDPSYHGQVQAEGIGFKEFATLVRHERADPADISHIAELYLAEVAYVDSQVGALLDGLRARGVLDHALVVVTADHGETLADQPMYAWSHGSNVAYEVMHVPLIVRGYGVPLAERAVIHRQAAMSGLASTIAELVGVDAAGLGHGLSFASFLRPGPVRDDDGWPEAPTIPVFVEATRPRSVEATKGWNNRRMHRGVWAGGYGGFSVPFLKRAFQFYDLGRPPSERVRDALTAMVAGWDHAAPAHVEPQMSDETRAALNALGYVE